MIAFSCVHCGQRMKITEEEGGKTAHCSQCNQVLVIPSSSSSSEGTRFRRRAKARPDSGLPVLGETTIIKPLKPVAEADLTPLPVPVVPDPAAPEVTRLEAAPEEREWTDFLAPPESDEELGRLGGYRILRVLGAGGMGVVFLAEEVLLQRRVALKAMRPTLAVSASARQRFLREARAIASIQHDHVVTIYRVDEDRGIPFLAMPYLAGESLQMRIDRQPAHTPLPLPEVIQIGRQIASGLSAIHDGGKIHRDIKPANVWLESPQGRVKILDFGLARNVGAQGEEQLTQVGTIVGSPAYMAPEQASPQVVDHRCDLFSLGVVLYQLATGQPPFEGEDALSVLLALRTQNPIPAIERNDLLPAAFSELLQQLLARQPQDRPSSAQMVLETLTQIEQDLEV